MLCGVLAADLPGGEWAAVACWQPIYPAVS